MGGIGSGRSFYGKSKEIVENQVSLKIKDLKEYEPKSLLEFRWLYENSRYSAWVYKLSDKIHIRLEHCGKSYPQTIELVKFGCHLGGFRFWFICPRCGSHRTILYLNKRSNTFSCRICNNLRYRSQKKIPCERSFLNAKILRKKYFDDENVFDTINSKPKFMHQSTFNNIKDRIYDYESRCLDHYDGWLNKAIKII